MDKNLNELRFTMTANIYGTSHKITFLANLGQARSKQEIARTAKNTLEKGEILCTLEGLMLFSQGAL